MHGNFPRNLDEKVVDYEQSYRWLKFGDVKGETESATLAAQDQAINTHYFKNIILREESDDKLRSCKKLEKLIHHLTSGFPVLAKNEYLMRHNGVDAHLHY
jgi:hypothetical protein